MEEGRREGRREKREREARKIEARMREATEREAKERKIKIDGRYGRTDSDKKRIQTKQPQKTKK